MRGGVRGCGEAELLKLVRELTRGRESQALAQGDCMGTYPLQRSGCHNLEEVGAKLLGFNPMKKAREEVRGSILLADRSTGVCERLKRPLKVPRHLTLTNRGNGEERGAGGGSRRLWSIGTVERRDGLGRPEASGGNAERKKRGGNRGGENRGKRGRKNWWVKRNWKQKEGVGAGRRERAGRRREDRGAQRRETEGARGRRISEARRGRAWLGASRPSCELRGINGPQLARLSAVFLAFPEEGEQSVGAGHGASATQRVRPRSWLSGPLLAPD